MQYKTKSEKETKEIGKKLIEKLIRKNNKKATVIALEGELGAGKTTFVKGIAEKLGIEKNVTSPTFLIVKKYPIKKEGFYFLFHIDAYRLNSEKELKNLDIKSILQENKNIVIVEWADNVSNVVPEEAIVVKFKHGTKKNERVIIINENNEKQQ